MKTRYSQLDLLNQRLFRKTKHPTFFEALKYVLGKTEYVEIQLHVPYYDLLRGKVLLHDVMELSGTYDLNLQVEEVLLRYYTCNI